MKKLILIRLILYLISFKISTIKGEEKCESKIELRAVLLSCSHKHSGCDDDDPLSLAMATEENKILGINSNKFSSLKDDAKKEFPNSVKECKRKLIITLKVKNAGKMPCDDEYISVDHVFDPETGGRGRLLTPVVLKLHQEQMLQLYGLQYQRSVNNDPFEEEKKTKEGCSVSLDNPTCGVTLYNGKFIPFSEGFCCSNGKKNEKEMLSGSHAQKKSFLYRNPKLITRQDNLYFQNVGYSGVILDPKLIHIKYKRSNSSESTVDETMDDDKDDYCPLKELSSDKLPNYFFEHDRRLICCQKEFLSDLCKLKDENFKSDLDVINNFSNNLIGNINNNDKFDFNPRAKSNNYKNIKESSVVVNTNNKFGNEKLINIPAEVNSKINEKRNNLKQSLILKTFIKSFSANPNSISENLLEKPGQGTRGKRENFQKGTIRRRKKKNKWDDQNAVSLTDFYTRKNRLKNHYRYPLLQLSSTRFGKDILLNRNTWKRKVNTDEDEKVSPPGYFFSHDSSLMYSVTSTTLNYSTLNDMNDLFSEENQNAIPTNDLTSEKPKEKENYENYSKENNSCKVLDGEKKNQNEQNGQSDSDFICDKQHSITIEIEENKKLKNEPPFDFDLDSENTTNPFSEETEFKELKCEDENSQTRQETTTVCSQIKEKNCDLEENNENTFKSDKNDDENEKIFSEWHEEKEMIEERPTTAEESEKKISMNLNEKNNFYQDKYEDFKNEKNIETAQQENSAGDKLNEKGSIEEIFQNNFKTKWPNSDEHFEKKFPLTIHSKNLEPEKGNMNIYFEVIQKPIEKVPKIPHQFIKYHEPENDDGNPFGNAFETRENSFMNFKYGKEDSFVQKQQQQQPHPSSFNKRFIFKNNLGNPVENNNINSIDFNSVRKFQNYRNLKLRSYTNRKQEINDPLGKNSIHSKYDGNLNKKYGSILIPFTVYGDPVGNLENPQIQNFNFLRGELKKKKKKIINNHNRNLIREYEKIKNYPLQKVRSKRNVDNLSLGKYSFDVPVIDFKNKISSHSESVTSKNNISQINRKTENENLNKLKSMIQNRDVGYRVFSSKNKVNFSTDEESSNDKKSKKVFTYKSRLLRSYENAPSYVIDKKNDNLMKKRQTLQSEKNGKCSTNSAHCLRFGGLWYGMYEIKKPVVSQTVGVQVFEKNVLFNGNSEWRDLTKGKMVRVGTFLPKAEDELPTFSMTYSGDNSKKISTAIDADNYMLLIPSHVSDPTKSKNYPQLEGGPDEYLVVRSKDVSSGSECNMIGTSFEAFSQQPDRCARPKGSCLTRQPVDLWREDMEARIRGKRGKYFVENFGTVPNSPVKTYSNLSGEYLALEYYGDYTSTIEIEMKADFNVMIRKGSSAQIPSVYVDSTYPDKTRIVLSVLNTGLTSSYFRPRLGDCPPNINPKWCPLEGPLVTIYPQQRHDFRLDLSGAMPSNKIHATVQVLDQSNKKLACRRITFKKSDRCLCAFHCKCNCVRNTDGRHCQRLASSDFRDAGYLRSYPFRVGTAPSTREYIKNNIRAILFICIYTLLLLGILKGILGFFCRKLGMIGMEIIVGPRKLKRYYESDLKDCAVRYNDNGYPVHPKNGCSVQLVPLCIEILLNFLFFFIYPIRGLWFMFLMLPCFSIVIESVADSEEEEEEEEEEEINNITNIDQPLLSESNPPTCVNYTLTTVNTMTRKPDEYLPYLPYKGDDDPMEEDDTDFVLQEMKRYRKKVTLL